MRTFPLSAWSRHDDEAMVGMGYYSDIGPVIEEESLNGYDADEEVFASCAVQKGDRVMIQSKISGKLGTSCHKNCKIYIWINI